MSSFNVVRFRVKPGQDQKFLEAHRSGKANGPGLERGAIIKTGECASCLIGKWRDMAALAGARGRMIATLDIFRDALEEFEAGSGVTDAVSGPVVLD
jgi:hypothetical protein